MSNLTAYLQGHPKYKFAEQAKISKAYLSQIMSGKRAPSLSLAFKIEKITHGHVPASSWVKESV